MSLPSLEKTISVELLFDRPADNTKDWSVLILAGMQSLLKRELIHRRLIVQDQSYGSKLVGFVVFQ